MSYILLSSIDKATTIIQISLGILFTVTIIVILVLFFVKKAGNTNKSALNSQKTKSNNQITDSRLFLENFDDIRDGIIICDNYTRFLSVLSCNGYDYATDSLDGQKSTVYNYIRFWAPIKEPITYRSSSKKIDADKPKTKYQKRIEELMLLQSDLQNQLEISNTDLTTHQIIISQINTLNETIYHLKQQLLCIDHYSSSEVISDTEQCYVFEWKFNPKDFSFHMTKEELFVQAKTELNAKAGDMLRLLSNCHVTAKIMNQAEVLDLFRHVSKPVSAEIFPMKQLDESTYYYDIQSSTTYDELSKAYEQEQRTNEEISYYLEMAEKEDQLAKLEDNR